MSRSGDVTQRRSHVLARVGFWVLVALAVLNAMLASWADDWSQATFDLLVAWFLLWCYDRKWLP